MSKKRHQFQIRVRPMQHLETLTEGGNTTRRAPPLKGEPTGETDTIGKSSEPCIRRRLRFRFL
ncbi:hypothetical protein YC2023_060302 [Brassica napus]